MSTLMIAGVDEAGRGSLAGPVVSAAVILRNDTKIDGLTDSKKISPEKRKQLAGEIKKECICWSVGMGSVEEIDTVNILRSTLLAMKRAVESLTVTPSRVLVDGNQLPDFDLPAQAIVKGDLLEPAISAASIIAKVTRDNLMYEYGNEFPEYGFERHAGYGTAYHLQALRQHGACSIHRRSFSPVRDVIEFGDTGTY